jgi:tol-pal system protein YbgF
MSSRRRVWTVVAIAFLFTGCAAETTEFKSLREQVRLQQKQIVDLKARQAEGQTKLEILDNGFRILGDKVEENALRLDDMDTLSSAPLSSAPVLSAAPAPAPIPAPAPAPRVERIVVAPPLSAADLYRSALDKFTQENYQGAILEFEEFVANHSSHDLADNAQYWIGECYYAEKNFELAVVEFDKVERHFNGGNKISAALLKKGLALRELGKNAEAAATLERVVSQFPQSDEAAMAERKLSQWR